MKPTAEVVRVKRATAWVDGAQEIHLKAVNADGKPVVLSAEETRKLAELLLRLAGTLESLQAEDGKG